jgi:hypothetical protein
MAAGSSSAPLVPERKISRWSGFRLEDEVAAGFGDRFSRSCYPGATDNAYIASFLFSISPVRRVRSITFAKMKLIKPDVMLTSKMRLPTGFGFIVMALIFVASVATGWVLGERLFLVFHYGWTRVTSESLHFVSSPKAKLWTVSNGDKISSGDPSLVTFLTFCVILAILSTSIPRLLGQKRMYGEKTE